MARLHIHEYTHKHKQKPPASQPTNHRTCNHHNSSNRVYVSKMLMAWPCFKMEFCRKRPETSVICTFGRIIRVFGLWWVHSFRATETKSFTNSSPVSAKAAVSKKWYCEWQDSSASKHFYCAKNHGLALLWLSVQGVAIALNDSDLKNNICHR